MTCQVPAVFSRTSLLMCDTFVLFSNCVFCWMYLPNLWGFPPPVSLIKYITVPSFWTVSSLKEGPAICLCHENLSPPWGDASFFHGTLDAAVFYCFGGDIIPAEECLSLCLLALQFPQSSCHFKIYFCLSGTQKAKVEVHSCWRDTIVRCTVWTIRTLQEKKAQRLSAWHKTFFPGDVSFPASLCVPDAFVLNRTLFAAAMQRMLWLKDEYIWQTFGLVSHGTSFFFFFGLNKNISSHFDLNCRLDFACSSCACGFSPVLGASSAVQRHIRLTGNSWVVC